MICPNCQAEMSPGLQACKQCGAPIYYQAARLVPLDQPPDIPILVLDKPVLTIGRVRSNDLYLPDASVSRLHARIRNAEGEYFLEDNGSRHGTQVNGQKVASHGLRPNDLVQIGIYRFRFAEARAAIPEEVSPADVEPDHLHLLLGATQHISSSLAVQEVLEYVMESVMQVTRAERGLLLLINEAGELKFTVARNLDQAGLESGKVAISYSTVERVRNSGSPVVLIDTLRGNERAYSGSVHALGLRSVMCVPLKVEERLLGVLNAIQAIDAEGEVRIQSRQQGDWLRITIEDTGKRMTPEQLARVYDPGFSRKQGRIGAGLGLAITRQILQEHQGKIQVESEPGIGTTVTLSLPLDETLRRKAEEDS